MFKCFPDPIQSICLYSPGLVPPAEMMEPQDGALGSGYLHRDLGSHDVTTATPLGLLWLLQVEWRGSEGRRTEMSGCDIQSLNPPTSSVQSISSSVNAPNLVQSLAHWSFLPGLSFPLLLVAEPWFSFGEHPFFLPSSLDSPGRMTLLQEWADDPN